jgi:hypothetical protein
MSNKPDIAIQLARHALALTRAGMLAADRAFMDIVEPGWDDTTRFDEELRRTRLVLELTPAWVEVYFGDDDRVMLKAHPSGAIVWVTVRGDAARMTRRIRSGLRNLGLKAAARAEGEDEAERRRAAARAESDRLVDELLPDNVTARRQADGKVWLQSADDPRVRVYTWADGENARDKVKAALARLERKVASR